MLLNYISFRFPGLEKKVRVAFQTRIGAALPSHPAAGTTRANISLEVEADKELTVANRRALASDWDLRGVAERKQVHGVAVSFEPDAQNPADVPEVEADGMALGRRPENVGLGLMIKTADCQPIMLAHKSGDYIMALHAGWKGNRQHCPRIAVAEFCARYKLNPADLMAVRGPSLGPAAAEFVHFEDEWGPDFSSWFDFTTRRMNLWMLTRHELFQAGLADENIYSLDLCTWTLPESFFSYRRNRACGRQASLIWLE